MAKLKAATGMTGLIPMPAEVTELTGPPFHVGATLKIRCAKGLSASAGAAQFLADCLAKSGGVKCTITRGTAGGGVSFAEGSGSLGDEGYALSVTDCGVVIRADTSAGFFYGVQTLRQLLPPRATFGSKAEAAPDFWIPAVEIRDRPAYRWRGLMLDACRHFFSTEDIRKMLDMLASQKLNVFHWHLTEDQAWRIEIRKHPRLTEVGAWRGGVGFGLDAKSTTHYRADGKYGGFYSQEDIRELVAYAAKLHIAVVPEIELPGHAVAALVAYPHLSCDPAAMAKKSMPEVQGICQDVYCAGKEETFAFLEDVLSEVVELFPGPYVHIGGDECPKDRWRECPACQKRIKDNGLKDEKELQSYVIRRIEAFLASKNRTLIGWDEILEGGLAPRVAVMSWRGTGGGIQAMKEGHDAVMSPKSHCYFDYPQAAHGEPKSFGSVLPLEKVYRFDPADGVPADARAHLLGAQGNLWTEYVPNAEHAGYMMAPRISALAEVLWSPRSRQDWAAFQARLRDQCARYEAAGFSYRKPGVEPPPKAGRTPLPNSDRAGRRLRIVTYNILGGRNTDGSCDLSRVAEVIKALNPDLAALQEVDVKTRRLDGADLPAELARLTGLKAAFAEAMPHDGGSYGEAVLTKLNVTQQTNHPLPYKQGREPRVALELLCEVPEIGKPVILIATHLDHLDDSGCRLLQIARLRELFTQEALSAPAILAGDLNAAAESAEVVKLCEFWQPTWPAGVPGFTWPADKPTARIDHVLIQPAAGWKVLKTYRGDEAFPGDAAWRELLNKASDHLPVVLELEIEPAG